MVMAESISLQQRALHPNISISSVLVLEGYFSKPLHFGTSTCKFLIPATLSASGVSVPAMRPIYTHTDEHERLQ